MFSTLADRPAPKSISPTETADSEANDNDNKRRRISSMDDRQYLPRRQESRRSSHPPTDAPVEDDRRRHQEFRSNFPVELPPVRILTTRYLLTTTGYKYIAIGITIKTPWYSLHTTPSYVDIALGDKQGREISLTLDMWKGLIERKRDVLSCMERALSDVTHPPSPMSIGGMTMRFGVINNGSIVRIELPNLARVAMVRTTLLKLYNLQFCVDRVIRALNAATEEVDAKFLRYREIAAAAMKMETSIQP
ncbi:uncharacterized protein LOC112465031 [Temnothorax curvispinosus]|uniref:Uncharacterized protein LOC112465031 n=1 Tax=Temnothorax curvispinosus TaxID=300111 RepID=A0A6J1QZL7_9HYME|nr:uncharacterized protein LOC112465031 [Temnothorax curvispinosus]